MTLPQFQHRRCHFLLPDSASESPTLLLLDTYPGAVAAYSLRKLRSAYSGALIRVRRSSDNAEADIGFDANGDLDTSALESHCGAGDGFVAKWYDQSGVTDDLQYPGATTQPQIVNTGVVLAENSLPGLFSRAGGGNLQQATLTVSQPFTMLWVHKTIAGGYTQLRSGSGICRLLHYIDSTLFNVSAGTDLNYGSDTGGQRIYSGSFNGASSEGWIDGSQVSAGNAGNNGLSGLEISLHANTSLSMQEVIVFEGNIVPNLSNLHADINNYYSVY